MCKTPCFTFITKNSNNKNGKRKLLETDGVLHGSITRPNIHGWQAHGRLSHK